MQGSVSLANTGGVIITKNKATQFQLTVISGKWKDCLRLLFVMETALVATSGAMVRAQSSGAQPSGPDQVQPEPRHDAWQMVPQVLLPPPSDSQQIMTLNERGAFFDPTSMSHVPL